MPEKMRATVGSPIAMERIAPMTSATAETPTWMMCLGFAIPLRVVPKSPGPKEVPGSDFREFPSSEELQCSGEFQSDFLSQNLSIVLHLGHYEGDLSWEFQSVDFSGQMLSSCH